MAVVGADLSEKCRPDRLNISDTSGFDNSGELVGLSSSLALLLSSKRGYSVSLTVISTPSSARMRAA